MESQIKEGGRRRDLEKSVSKKIGRAIADYGMIKDGDKILVAVSGGKDSLTLLKFLSLRKKFVPIRYDILALHVDLGYRCVNKDVLKKFLEDNGYSYHFKKLDILKGKRREEKISHVSGVRGIVARPCLKPPRPMGVAPLPWDIIRMISRRRS